MCFKIFSENLINDFFLACLLLFSLIFFFFLNYSLKVLVKSFLSDRLITKDRNPTWIIEKIIIWPDMAHVKWKKKVLLSDIQPTSKISSPILGPPPKVTKMDYSGLALRRSMSLYVVFLSYLLHYIFLYMTANCSIIALITFGLEYILHCS